MYGTYHFEVRDLGNRTVQYSFPNVDGFSYVTNGRVLYEVIQSGVAQITRDATGGKGEIRRLHWEDRPDVKNQKVPVSIDCGDGRILNNCILISTQTFPTTTPKMRGYRWVFRQISPGEQYY